MVHQMGMLDFTMQALIIILQLSMPPIIVATIAGLLVSFFQAVTQLQEQTLGFAVKLVAVAITIVLTASWLGGEIFTFSMNLFNSFPHVVR